MAVATEEVLQELKKGKYSPIYFLQGEEPFFIDQIAEFIEKNCLTISERSINQTILYGKETSLSQVIQRARQFPMMSDKTVIIVKEAQEMSDFAKEGSEKILDAYIKQPLASTILVFCYKNKKVDARRAISKALEKFTVFVNSEKVKDYKLNEWIANYFHINGLKATPQATNLLAENIGNDLSRIANEIDKLLINLKKGTEIDEEIIQKYVGISKEFNVFELQKAIALRDYYKANLIVNHFDANEKMYPLVMTVSSLFNYFTKILLVHNESDRSDFNLAKVLGVPPFLTKDYAKTASLYPFQKIIESIHFIRKADAWSKGIDAGAMKDGQILRELVFKIMH